MFTQSFCNSKSHLAFDQDLFIFLLALLLITILLITIRMILHFPLIIMGITLQLIMKCNIEIHKYIREQQQGNNILKVSYLFKAITDEKTTLCDWAKFSLWPLHAPSDTHTVVHSPFSPHIQINQQKIHIEASAINCTISKLTEQIKTKLHLLNSNLMGSICVLSTIHEIIKESTIIMI